MAGPSPSRRSAPVTCTNVSDEIAATSCRTAELTETTAASNAVLRRICTSRLDPLTGHAIQAAGEKPLPIAREAGFLQVGEERQLQHVPSGERAALVVADAGVDDHPMARRFDHEGVHAHDHFAVRIGEVRT